MTKAETNFIHVVWDHYQTAGRHELPWRQTTDPYLITVSEMMLQQTQVDRVLPKYHAFTSKWPTAASLTKASLGEVLVAWQGLGYNRRAKMLHQCAKQVVEQHKSTWPQTYAELLLLPGIGPYTAGAVMAFAYNQPMPIIETNIRTAYIYHFFKNTDQVSEAALAAKITKTLDQSNSREWYWALMDYGSHLKKTHGNLNKKATNYTKQSKFAGSDRQIRGAIIRVLTVGERSKTDLLKTLPHESDRITKQLQSLLAEKMVIKTGKNYSLPK